MGNVGSWFRQGRRMCGIEDDFSGSAEPILILFFKKLSTVTDNVIKVHC